ncbi:hypothetical protein [Streptomyces sp. NPDC048489]|uniref:hypothetical protein n=1 Tax=Streptomyces sp. NPDC048489 TaxID=3154504 RepID=UPI0034340B6F
MSSPLRTESRAGCTVDAGGRITFGLRLTSAARPQLLLRLRPKKGQPEDVTHLLDVEAGDDGRLTAVLPAGLTLCEGRWDAYVLREADGRRERLRPGIRDLRALVDGSSRDRSSPIAVRVPYVTKDGYLAVRSWLRTMHAEVERIQAADHFVTVSARLHGRSLGQGATVRLRLRGTSTARTLEPEVEDDRRSFSFTLDSSELVDVGGDNGVWDVFVQAEGNAPSTRIGRLLDDVADRKGIFVYPSITLGATDIRPYYTVDNDLSLEVTRQN